MQCSAAFPYILRAEQVGGFAFQVGICFVTLHKPTFHPPLNCLAGIQQNLHKSENFQRNSKGGGGEGIDDKDDLIFNAEKFVWLVKGQFLIACLVLIHSWMICTVGWQMLFANLSFSNI